MFHELLNRKYSTQREEGFTLVELMVVIIIIGILAAIAIPIFANQQKAANEAVQKQDLRRIEQSIILAKANKGNVSLFSIVGKPYHAGECVGASDYSKLARTHTCWVDYMNSLDKISAASGMDIRGLVDPYGRPYIINPNEGEVNANDCRVDEIGYWHDVYTSSTPGWKKSLPMTTGACS